MKRLIAFIALSLFVVNANAVTAAKSSPTKKTTSAPITETPIKDDPIISKLEAEVGAEKPSPSAPVQKNSPEMAALYKAQAANKPPTTETTPGLDPSLVSATPAPTDSLMMQDATEGDLALDDNALEAQTAANLATQESSTYIDVMPKKKEKNWYISGAVGTIGYPDVSNITGQYAASASIGYIMDGMFMFEAGLGIAQYKMESLNPTILNRMDKFDIDQYSATAAAKYRYAFGRVVPNGGVIVQLTQRNFLQRDPNNIGNNSVTAERGNSQTTDAGFIGGVDFEMNRDFAIGVEAKFLTNVANSADEVVNINSNTQSGYNVTPIEKLQSYSAGISARMNF